MRIMSTIISLSSLINHAFQYVIKTSELYKIDESHAVKHSMEVFGFAKRIYDSEIKNNPLLEDQKDIIFTAAIGHDMCDKKYMNETEGIITYQKHLLNFMRPKDLIVLGKIIATMSYSKVKANGYPELGEHQLAYHIVREADLLAAYDIDRCVMYKMSKDKCEYIEALNGAFQLFDERVFKMRKDGLFKTSYSKKESLRLHKKAEKDIASLRNLI